MITLLKAALTVGPNLVRFRHNFFERHIWSLHASQCSNVAQVKAVPTAPLPPTSPLMSQADHAPAASIFLNVMPKAQSQAGRPRAARKAIVAPAIL